MDSDNAVYGDGSEVLQQNGIQEQLTACGEATFVSNGLNGTSMESSVPDANSEYLTRNFEEESRARMQSKKLSGPKEIAKDGNQPTQSKPQKSKIKVKAEKAPHPKIVSASGMKKSKDEKEVDASTTVPNGHDASNPCPKQPLETRSCSNSHAHPTTQQPGKSPTTSSEDLVEKTKLKPLKKGPHTKAEGDTQSSPSPTSGDAKAQKAGALPNYGFSFKCSERAEKRREFYTKLEEMTLAKEEEKNTLQAKTKESQQAEIKKFRQSLAFKATPMPSFYQEPPPPKVELKKIPITRAKSPKLGRKKIKDKDDAEGNSSLLVRLSLDERVNSTTGSSPIHVKQPSRNSLPGKLPSAKKTPSKTTNERKKSSLKVNRPTNGEKTSCIAVDETSTEQSKTQFDANNGPVVEEQPQPAQL